MTLQRKDGLCPACGKRPRLEGRSYCRECQNRKASERYRAKGGRKPGKRQCRHDGLCPRCGERTHLEGKSYCAQCAREYHAARRRRMRLAVDSRPCARCGKTQREQGSPYCAECRREALRRRKARLCALCGRNPRPAAPRHSYCRKCASAIGNAWAWGLGIEALYRKVDPAKYNDPDYLEPDGRRPICPLCREDRCAPWLPMCDGCIHEALPSTRTTWSWILELRGVDPPTKEQLRYYWQHKWEIRQMIRREAKK